MIFGYHFISIVSGHFTISLKSYYIFHIHLNRFKYEVKIKIFRCSGIKHEIQWLDCRTKMKKKLCKWMKAVGDVWYWIFCLSSAHISYSIIYFRQSTHILTKSNKFGAAIRGWMLVYIKCGLFDIFVFILWGLLSVEYEKKKDKNYQIETAFFSSAVCLAVVSLITL